MTRHSLARRTFIAGVGILTLGTALPAFSAATAPLKIGMIGGGTVSTNLAKAWIKTGHQVMLSSRNPDSLKDKVAALGPNARAGTVAEAVAFGDVVLLAVPYTAVPEIAKEHGKALATKILVMDASNPIPDRDGEFAAMVRKIGVGEYAAGLMPGAKIVRTFNGFGAARFSEGGKKDGVQMGMPVSGSDPQALAVTTQLVRETGYEPVLVGNVALGKHLMPREPLGPEMTPDEIRRIAATLK